MNHLQLPLTAVMDKNNNKKPNELLINFESPEHVKQLLYRLSLVDVMKINNLNKNNKIIQDFLQSVFN